MTEREKNGLICFSDIFFGKWKLLILYELADGPKRFKELRDTNQNISAKVLTESIQDLMNEGLIVRISYPEVPPRVNYFLSKYGKCLFGERNIKITAVNGQPLEIQKTNNAGKKASDK